MFREKLRVPGAAAFLQNILFCEFTLLPLPSQKKLWVRQCVVKFLPVLDFSQKTGQIPGRQKG